MPRTLVTNCADAVRRFAATLPGGVVVKPLGAASIVEEGVRKPLYTHLLTAADLDDLAGVESAAHLFQRYVDKSYEVRLTVVGRRLFAAAIHQDRAE